jgi:hypothetical protein
MEVLPKSIAIPNSYGLYYYYPRKKDEQIYAIVGVVENSFNVIRNAPDGSLTVDVVPLQIPYFGDITQRLLLLHDRIHIFGDTTVLTYYIKTKTYDNVVRYTSPVRFRISRILQSLDFFRLEYEDHSYSPIYSKDSVIIDLNAIPVDVYFLSDRNNLVIVNGILKEMMSETSFVDRDLGDVLFYERRDGDENFVTIRESGYHLRSGGVDLVVNEDHKLWDAMERIFPSRDASEYEIMCVGTTVFVSSTKLMKISVETGEIGVLTDLRLWNMLSDSKYVFVCIPNYSVTREMGDLLIVVSKEKFDKLRIYGYGYSKWNTLSTSIILNRDLMEGYAPIICDSSTFESIDNVVDTSIFDELGDPLIFVYDPILPFAMRYANLDYMVFFNDFRDLDRIIQELSYKIDEYVVFDAAKEKFL